MTYTLQASSSTYSGKGTKTQTNMGKYTSPVKKQTAMQPRVRMAVAGTSNSHVVDHTGKLALEHNDIGESPFVPFCCCF